jgi:adenylate cyclase
MGDAVNTAARLESLTKELGADVIVSDSTARHLGDGIAVTPLGQATVKGKAEPLEIFTVTDAGAAPRSGR